MGNESSNTINVQLEADQEISITKKDKFKPKTPPFFMAGNGNTRFKITSIDLISELCTFNTSEQFAFTKLIEKLEPWKDSRKKHNVCVVIVKTLGKDEQKFGKGIRSLTDKGLVKRIKREHYLINPNMIITQNYQEDLIEWNKY